MYGRGITEIGPKYSSPRIYQQGFGVIVQGGGIGDVLSRVFTTIFPYLKDMGNDLKREAISSGKRQISKISSDIIRKLDGSGKKRKKKSTKSKSKSKKTLIQFRDFSEFPPQKRIKPNKKKSTKKPKKSFKEEEELF